MMTKMCEEKLKVSVDMDDEMNQSGLNQNSSLSRERAVFVALWKV